jgi:hypothetical protein
MIAILVVSLPFGQGPAELLRLLSNAGQEYPYTSLYAFNIWAIEPGFWKPDDGLVVWGGVLLAAACLASVAQLWRRRDLAAILAVGALTSLAFYFLPTRAHERYLFPAVALLVPFAAARWRVLPGWIVVSALYAVTLLFALVRTIYTDVRVSAAIDTGLFGRSGQILLAVAMCLAAFACAALVATVDRSLRAHPIGWAENVRAVAVRIRASLIAGADRVAGRIALERAHPRRAQRAVLAVVLLVPMLFNAALLAPEIGIAIPSNNDDANHFVYVQRADEALRSGANPIDFWALEMELGFPPFVYYQHLPHLAVVALHRALLPFVDLFTLFNVVRWLLLVILPITVCWSLRRLGVPAPGAVFAGAAAALVSGGARFGIEYDSFVWRGWGMYTQLWGVHLTFLSLALLHDLLERGRGLVRTILVVAALALSHLIWAYMAAISAVVLFAVGLRRATWRVRVGRLLAAGAGATVITSYMWLPFLQSRAYLNVSQPYLPQWRFDSFGFGQISTWIVTGDLLDHARLPVLTALAALGIGAALRTRDRLAALALALGGVWVVLWSGRTSLGALADLLPFSRGLHVHRFVGGVDVAAVLLIALAAAALWRFARADAGPRRAIATGALLIALLVPAMAERADYYGRNTWWMTETRDAIARDGDLAGVIAALDQLPLGRVYAGLNDDWQRSLDLVPFNSTRIPDILNASGIPRVAKPYASLSLDADVLFSFDPAQPAMWDLFNARYAIARAGQPVPSFLVPARTVGSYVIYAAPTSGWTAFAERTTRASAADDRALFFKLLEGLKAVSTAPKDFVRYEYPSSQVVAPDARGWCADGRVSYERMQRDRFDALLGCDGPATLVIKVSYHPNWRVAVDDRPVETFMVSPGFIGLELPAGQHFVTARYASTPIRAPLVGVGLVGALALAFFRRRLVRPPWTT